MHDYTFKLKCGSTVVVKGKISLKDALVELDNPKVRKPHGDGTPCNCKIVDALPPKDA